MTQEEKNKIYQLRDEGNDFIAIGKIIGASPSTIESFLRRHPKTEIVSFCKCCGAEMVNSKRKCFCSDGCVRKYHHHRRYADPSLATERTCEYCGKNFFYFKGKPRKYCSLECSHLGRRKNDGKQ